jgi:hypothetical protein
VLAELYPTSASHEISFRTMTSLADELEDWSTNLAPHLKLTFAQDKPSTNTTSSRAPVLVCARSVFVVAVDTNHSSLLLTTMFGP